MLKRFPRNEYPSDDPEVESCGEAMRIIIRALFFVLAIASVARAGESTQGFAAAIETSAPAGEQLAPGVAEDPGPVPVPEPGAKALRYHRSGHVLWFVDLAWGFLIPSLFLFTGFSSRLRDVARRIGRRRFFTLVIYFVLFMIINFVLDLPLGYYEGFVREHAYGLSNQTFGKWFGDELKGLMVGLVAGSLLLWVPYLLLKKSPKRWWLYTSLCTIPVAVFFSLVAPIWVDPLFNKFGPMKDKALEARIVALAESAGIQGGRVYEVDKSVDTETVNAYVTGFGNTKRIVLWDTILAKLNPDEILFVMGHEMGHYVLGHVVKSILFLSVLALVTLWAAHRLSAGILARWKGRFGFDALGDIASLPLILLLVSLFSLVIGPVGNAYSRWQEHEADRFGLEITRGNHAAATAFVKLQQENLDIPRPGLLYKLWRAGHPLLGERIDFCNEYKPWADGRALKYGGMFKVP